MSSMQLDFQTIYLTIYNNIVIIIIDYDTAFFLTLTSTFQYYVKEFLDYIFLGILARSI